MPRRKVETITYIYWLIDTRTGDPFYCGKTIRKPKYRLGTHIDGSIRRPNRALSRRIQQITAEFIAIQTIDIVPIGGDWVNAERLWIAFTRTMFIDCVNITRGGEGAPGHVHTEQWKRNLSARTVGRVWSPESRLKMSIAMKGNKCRTGKPLSPEGCLAMSIARKGRKRGPCSEQRRARISAAQKGRPLAPEHVQKLKEAWKRRKALTIAKIDDSQHAS